MFSAIRFEPGAYRIRSVVFGVDNLAEVMSISYPVSTKINIYFDSVTYNEIEGCRQI